MIIENCINVKDYVTKSNLPSCDFVINPYVGCPHACTYCYACFMKRFTGHLEAWGTFIDIKMCDKPLNAKKLQGKSVFLSSVTDCYNPFEEKYRITRSILEQLSSIDCNVSIGTKSSLILRDIDILTKCRNVTVAFSVNTLDENFKNDMDNAHSIADRLNALRILHEKGIRTVLFMSPIFPGISDFEALISATKNSVDEYWFENLNLRGSYKPVILQYIAEKYPQYESLYKDIYLAGNMTYWSELAKAIDIYCIKHEIRYINYFYHEQLVKNKRSKT